MIFYHNFKRC